MHTAVLINMLKFLLYMYICYGPYSNVVESVLSELVNETHYPKAVKRPL